MERPTEESTDGSSIKPVSSLRSHFENMLSGNCSPTGAAPPRQPSPGAPNHLTAPETQRRNDGRISLDIPRGNGIAPPPPNQTDYSGTVSATTPRGRSLRTPWSTPKTRPSSMMAFSPPRALTRSPPKVEIHSPASPGKSPSPVHSPLPGRPLPRSSYDSPTPGSSYSNGRGFFKIASRNGTPGLESSPKLQSTSAMTSSSDPRKSGFFDRSKPAASTPPVPPPINRAGKPKILSKSHSVEPAARSTSATLAPDPTFDGFGESASPFSTPPSSSEGSPTKIEGLPPDIPMQSKPRAGAKRDSYFPPPPMHHAVADQLPLSDARSTDNPPMRQVMSKHTRATSDLPQDRPSLPMRKDNLDMRKSMVIGRPPEPPIRRSLDTYRPPSAFTEADSKFKPPPKRTNTLPSSSAAPPAKALEPPKPPPPRNSGEFRRPAPTPAPVSTPSPRQASTAFTYDSDDGEADKATPAMTDYPDSSQANRRPPIFKEGPAAIPTKYDTKLFAICGEYICTTGYVTRVWSLLNGEMLMSLSHGDTVKATSVAFRPAKDVEEEGKRLWLGTNVGEMHEIDIPTHSIVYTKTNAHPRCSIIKIYRHASEMWSLDDEGTVHIWPPDDTGSPTLAQTPGTFRMRRGHTFSIISGSQLWVAFGKEIRVFSRTGDNNNFQQVTDGGLSQQNVGEVTSGAILSSQPDRIYFGHIDGKVSIYSRKGFNCLGVVSVSLYKISTLVGVGHHLWAGYITGMIYVYDISCTPWKVMKDWKAHESTIAGILADRTSIWKLDRLQVASLGTDNILRIWDGMLKEDWLESQMQQNDSEYCDFREVSAVVMTWNAGATKPTTLRHNEQDTNFYRELLQPRDPPDILVFGFQELVDLEDKKVTAKSFFKKKKHKDATDNEHMSHQYRAWRDHLIRVVDEMLPHENYTLLHTANLVGLFTCILVKTTERMQIRDVCAAQVKLGMGGLHGNKGALIVRFFIDDSSLCFINCHLAAGQTQTVHRNNDIAAIMEAEALPRNRSPSACADSFVGGGDGSMILDHEICILNGDLNYRIDAMPRHTVIDAVKQGNLAKLLDRDQLLLSRKRNPGFRLRAFNESPINFAPTYKYDVGTDNYDTSDKKRSPAWCDRLLYRGLGRIKQIDYRRHDGVKVSDHRPVSGRFRIRVKTINAKRQLVAKERAEAEFEAVKRRIAGDIKLDYLITVFGLGTKEAQRLLRSA